MTTDPAQAALSDADFAALKVKEISEKLRLAKQEIAKEIYGQDELIENVLICMIAGGNLLMEGLPGLAKTHLLKQISTVMGLSFKRVQFTSDLMPSDIIGSEVLKEGNKIEFEKGPVFTQLLMADEINRGSPKTQGALLEAMQEKKVTSGGKTYSLQKPFCVMATQNPLEQEGTYPLPEAQLDRFLMKLTVDYPDEDSEIRVMRETTQTRENIRNLFQSVADGADLRDAPDKDEKSRVTPILGENDLILFQKLARSLPLSDDVAKAAAKMVRSARPDDNAPGFIKDSINWGPGTRALQAFSLAAKARALFHGRLAPDVGDLLAVAEPVLQHRMELTFSAKANGETVRNVIRELKREIS